MPLKKNPVKKPVKKPVESVTKIDNISESDNESDIELEPYVDKFLTMDKFSDFNADIKFHVFDPEKYKTEMHKEITIVPNNYRKTSDIISQYELTDVTSNRAIQIENGSKIFVDIGDESNPVKMAEMEIRMKKCPLSVMRHISSNIAEVWEVNDMIVLL